MALDLLSGGITTFVLIGAFLMVIVLLYRSFFGNKPLSALLGGVAKGIGGGIKSISSLRTNTKKELNDELRFKSSTSKISEITGTVSSQIAKVKSEQDFNPDRVRTIKEELKAISSSIREEFDRNKSLLQEFSQDRKNASVVEAKKVIGLQNSIEAKVAFLENRLKQNNLSYPNLSTILMLAEEIKKSSLNIDTLEQQENQVLTGLINIVESRSKVITNLQNLIDATQKLLDQDPPLQHITEIETNITKINEINNTLSQPEYSIENLLKKKDEIAVQLEREIIQIQERNQSQEQIKRETIQFIQSQIARGAAPKNLDNVA